MARMLKLSVLTLGLSAAAAAELDCEHGARGCAAATASAEDAGLGLLQQSKAAKTTVKKHRHRRSIRQDPNATAAVWDQIKGAVHIDELEAELTKVVGNGTAAQLTEQLNDLQKQFPSAKDIQKQFSSEWSNLTAAVQLDGLEAQINQAKASGNATLQDLEAQYESLKAQLPAVNITQVQDQAAGYYEDLLDAGVPLPGLDTVSNLTSQAMDAASDAWDVASDAASSVGSSVSDALGGLWR